MTPAGTTDLPTIAALAQEIWREHYPGIISREQIEYMLSRMYDHGELARQLAAGIRFDLAWPGGTARDGVTPPIAFAAYGAVEARALAHASRETRLHKLYVLKDHRRGGVATALIARVCAFARAAGSTTLSLTVNRANTGAITAYERLGFSIRESVRVDIGGGFAMDDHVMALPLG